MENDISTRKDLGYSSEVNSCDSAQDAADDAESTYVPTKNEAASLKLLLEKNKQALHKKNLECEKLKALQEKVEAEIEDLTASLFEEANKMVYDANLKQDKAEKKLAAAEGKIEALETEVSALKSLVITSTPSNPNPTSHPQLIKKSESSPLRSIKKNIFDKTKTEKKRFEEFEIERMNESTPLCTFMRLNKEVDEALFSQLKQWYEDVCQQQQQHSSSSNGILSTFCNCKQTSAADCSPLDQCQMISQSDFLRKIFNEDISPCLAFANHELAVKVSSFIHKNLLSVELATNPLLKSTQLCSLSKTRSPCRHRIRFADADSWHSISQGSRNRITSVCDFFTYLRYIRQGIVKHDLEQMYWEIVHHRLEIAFATLGYCKDQS